MWQRSMALVLCGLALMGSAAGCARPQGRPEAGQVSAAQLGATVAQVAAADQDAGRTAAVVRESRALIALQLDSPSPGGAPVEPQAAPVGASTAGPGASPGRPGLLEVMQRVATQVRSRVPGVQEIRFAHIPADALRVQAIAAAIARGEPESAFRGELDQIYSRAVPATATGFEQMQPPFLLGPRAPGPHLHD